MKNVLDILILEKAWSNFREVVSGIPQSETTSFLDSKAEEVLEILDKERNDLFSVSDQSWIVSIRMATDRVSEIIRSSPVVLDIDDMMVSLNKALVAVDTGFAFASNVDLNDPEVAFSRKAHSYDSSCEDEAFFKEFPELLGSEKSNESDKSN